MGGKRQQSASDKRQSCDSSSYVSTTPTRQGCLTNSASTDMPRPKTHRTTKDPLPSRSKSSRTGAKGSGSSMVGLEGAPVAQSQAYSRSQPTDCDAGRSQADRTKYETKELDVSDQSTGGLTTSLYGRDLNAASNQSSKAVPRSQPKVLPESTSVGVGSEVFVPSYARKERKQKVKDEPRSKPGVYVPVYAREDWVFRREQKDEREKGKDKKGESRIMSKVRRLVLADSGETRSGEKRAESFQRWSKQCESQLEDEVAMNESDVLMSSTLGDIDDILAGIGSCVADYDQPR